MATELRIGDSANVGPFNGRYEDGSPINLTNAKMWASVSLTRGGTAIFTCKNAASSGGSDDQLYCLTPAEGGPVWVLFTSAQTALLEAGKTYHVDVRCLLDDGDVHTIGEADFKAIRAYTAVPTA